MIVRQASGKQTRFAVSFLTPDGAALARRVITILKFPHSHGCSISLFDRHKATLKNWVEREFHAANALVFIGATGIAIRMINGLLQSKAQDPAVLVLDERGNFVIPLLSGHLGGANSLAKKLAEALGAQAVITTATDLNKVFAPDEWARLHNCVVDDSTQIKAVSAALLQGKKAGLHSDFPLRGPLPQGLILSPEEYGTSFNGSEQVPGISISLSPLSPGTKPFAHTLRLIPRIAVLGAGCRKDTLPEAFERFVLETLAAHHISVKALHCLASLDRKRDEVCLLAFADKYDLTFEVFSPEELQAIPGSFTVSNFVQDQTGVDNVCERAAMAAGAKQLLIPKISRQGMTLALAITPWQADFTHPDASPGASSPWQERSPEGRAAPFPLVAPWPPEAS